MARVRGRATLSALDDYVRSCLASRVAPRVPELARSLEISRGTLINAVKELRGTTPGKYLRQRQVDRAKEYLQRGWPLERVAHEAGYGSQRAFFRSFRAATGI